MLITGSDSHSKPKCIMAEMVNKMAVTIETIGIQTKVFRTKDGNDEPRNVRYITVKENLPYEDACGDVKFTHCVTGSVNSIATLSAYTSALDTIKEQVALNGIYKGAKGVAVAHDSVKDDGSTFRSWVLESIDFSTLSL